MAQTDSTRMAFAADCKRVIDQFDLDLSLIHSSRLWGRLCLLTIPLTDHNVLFDRVQDVSVHIAIVYGLWNRHPVICLSLIHISMCIRDRWAPDVGEHSA